MSNATHTPGPWQNNGIDLIDGGPRFGAQLFTTQVGEPISDGEMYANACLIAAAPELLEAVGMLLPSNLGSLHTGDFDDDFIIPVDMTVAEIRKARAAIAKAKGGAA